MKNSMSDGNFLIKGTVLVEYLGSAASVEIPQGITEIGERAFYAMPIRTVSLPAGLTAIGDQAFTGTQLRTVDLPVGLTAIGDSAFSGTLLRAVSLPAGLTTIGEEAFLIETLASITVDPRSNSFTAVDGVLFDKAMKTLHTYPQRKAGSRYTIPASVTAIGDHAFSDTQLRAVDLPAGLTAIGFAAFIDAQLREADLPAGLTSIGDLAFAFCENLCTVELSRKTKVSDYAFEDSPQVELLYRD